MFPQENRKNSTKNSLSALRTSIGSPATYSLFNQPTGSYSPVITKPFTPALSPKFAPIGESGKSDSLASSHDSLFGWNSPITSRRSSLAVGNNNTSTTTDHVVKTLNLLGLDDDNEHGSSGSLLLSGSLKNSLIAPPTPVKTPINYASVCNHPSDSLLSFSFENPSKSLFVSGLPPSISLSDFLSFYERFGKIESNRLVNNNGFVTFSCIEDAIKAKNESNGFPYSDGFVLKVKFSSDDKDFLSSSSSSLLGQSSLSPVFGLKSSSSPFIPSAAPFNPTPFPQAPVAGVNISSAPFVPEDNKWSQESPDDNSIETPLNYFPEENQFHFYKSIPPLKHIVEHNPDAKCHTLDSGYLRELKRKLDFTNMLPKDMDLIFEQMLPEIVELATDGFGNTVVQKLVEKCSDPQRFKIIELCAPQLASIGIHKNGTWVVQKLMEFAKTPNQVQTLLYNLKPFTPSLMLDPFGNYVIQACLRLGPQKDQFVFDTMYLKCLDIGQGKFGARAMRACLESQFATKKQQKLVAAAVVNHALVLVTDPNGILLIHWLVDNSDLEGRFRVLVDKLLPKITSLSNQKLSHVVVLKILTQNLELDAKKNMIVNGIFKDDDSVAATIFGGESPFSKEDHFSYVEPCEYGTSIVLRCLQLEQDPNVKFQMTKIVRNILENAFEDYRNFSGRGQFYKRLIEELQQPTVTKPIDSLPKSPFINTKHQRNPSDGVSSAKQQPYLEANHKVQLFTTGLANGVSKVYH